MKPPENRATLRSDPTPEGVLTFTIDGRLNTETTGGVWREATEILDRSSPDRLVVEAAAVDYCDGSGIALLLELQRRQKKRGSAFEIRNLRPEFDRLLSFFDPAEFDMADIRKAEPDDFPEEVGKAAYAFAADLKALVAFIGEIGASLSSAVLNPRRVRWRDVF